jgi:hypothetical protein
MSIVLRRQAGRRRTGTGDGDGDEARGRREGKDRREGKGHLSSLFLRRLLDSTVSCSTYSPVDGGGGGGGGVEFCWFRVRPAASAFCSECLAVL